MSETAADMSREAFTLGHGDWTRKWMGERTASSHAAFFLPHLRRGMALLDCGCGPGSITLDLAELLAPGEVVGVDLSARELATARELARARGVTNVAFQEADVYRLPFQDGCFDAVFAHSLLMHLRDPLGALREMRRILRPGGVLGVRDPDYGAWLWTPATRAVEEFSSLFVRVLIHNGGSPFYARDQRRLLSEAGFESSEATAQAIGYGSSEATAVTARIMIEIASSEEFREAARHEAPELARRIDELCEGLQAWAASPQAFYAMLFVSSVARKAGGLTEGGRSPGGRT